MDFIKICLHAMPLVSGIRNILIAKKFGVGAFMYYKKHSTRLTTNYYVKIVCLDIRGACKWLRSYLANQRQFVN